MIYCVVSREKHKNGWGTGHTDCPGKISSNQLIVLLCKMQRNNECVIYSDTTDGARQQPCRNVLKSIWGSYFAAASLRFPYSASSLFLLGWGDEWIVCFHVPIWIVLWHHPSNGFQPCRTGAQSDMEKKACMFLGFIQQPTTHTSWIRSHFSPICLLSTPRLYPRVGA